MTIGPQSTPNKTIEPRRALEALRNGVPNRDAVRVLGCDQDEVEMRFRDQLAALVPAMVRDECAPGLLVSGDFGTGKSHVLEHLQHLALSNNFVCSRVVVSKETPLHDLSKVFKAAIETAELPDRTGPAMSEIALKLRPDSAKYSSFFKWVHSAQSGLGPMFPATLKLYESLKSDGEILEEITNFWSGEPLPLARVRLGLRQIGESSSYSVKAIKLSDLAPQRFSFFSRLVVGAGYAGWVILIDEAELIGRYTILQRGKSYAQLACLLGHVPGAGFPGTAVVATITDDFGIKVLGEKGDLESVGIRLRSKGKDDSALLAARAEIGMRIIDRERTVLSPPVKASLLSTYTKLKRVHAEAYGWDPPEVWEEKYGPPRRMRSHVRRWIAEWDLHRLYPGSQPEIEENELHVDYSEDEAFEGSDDSHELLESEA